MFGTNQLSTPANGGFLAKLDRNGNYLWAKSITTSSGCGPVALAVDGAGGVLITGYYAGHGGTGLESLSNSVGNFDIFVAKFNEAGDLLWAIRAGGMDFDEPKGLAVNSAGEVFLAGFFRYGATFGTRTVTNPASASPRGFISKLNSSGAFQWVALAAENNLGSVPPSPMQLAVAADAAGNSYLAGAFSGSLTLGTNSLTGYTFLNAFIAKLDNGGNYLWARQSANPSTNSSSCRPRALALDGTGGLAAVGSFSGELLFGTNLVTTASPSEAFILHLDSDGNITRCQQGGGGQLNSATSVAIDSAGSVYVSGFMSADATFGATTLAGRGSLDAVLFKLSRKGTFLWATNLGGLNSDAAYGVAVDPRGDVCLVGYFMGNAMFGSNAVTADPSYETTFVTRFTPSRPELVTQKSGNALSVLWPSTAVGFQLETIGSLFPRTVWSTAPGSRHTNDDFIRIDVPSVGTPRFFRLVRP